MLRTVAGIAAKYAGAQRIGVSTAGEVDAATGVIRYAANIPGYTGLPVKKLLQEMTQMPVALENDVNAAALGEMHFGAGKQDALTNFLMVNYGTGIGGAIVLNGALHYGMSGSAGEIGGLITHPEAVTSEVGSGSYERYASTAALVRHTTRLSPKLNSGRAVFAAIGHRPVQMLVQRWIDEVAAGLVGAIHLLNPQAVVLGGGILSEEMVFSGIQKRVLPMLKPTFATTQIVRARLGGQASMYGAGLLASKIQL
ncbi:ROK family protein [Ruminococcaceae bacterium OttesenSCG-928-A16]|nr:ROK family protein [Ruminococcaceae bacterium OttesenSCG-928-A16]